MENKEQKKIYYPGGALRKDFKGSEIVVSNDVVASIIKESTKKVKGFVRFSGTIVYWLNRVLNLNSRSNGITINNQMDENNKNTLEIDLSVVLEYGINITSVCCDIQNTVLENINKCLNVSVSNINVYVSDIESNNKLDKQK